MSRMKEFLFDRLESAPKTTIGAISLQVLDSETVWLANESGEGGEFPRAEVEKVLTDFFHANF